MSGEFVRYRRLERRLWLIRWRNMGRESVHEDEILDEMDSAWRQLSDQDQAVLRSEGPRCWPMDSTPVTRQSSQRGHPEMEPPARELSRWFDSVSSLAQRRYLRVSLGAGHWQAALENLCAAEEAPGLELFGLPSDSSALRFKAELDAAIEQAGFLDRTSLLNREDRKVAVGLAVN